MQYDIPHCVERASYYREEILQEVSKHKTPDSGDRSFLATAYVKMVVSDFDAIITETKFGNRAAAFKLLRALYEDVVNALWVQAFATDAFVTDLLHGKVSELPGSMSDRAAKLDTIFIDPTDQGETIFAGIQAKLWKAACSYTHGGALAINRALAGYDDESTFQLLRTSTTLFVLFIDAIYKLLHKKRNDAVRNIAQTYFDEKWNANAVAK